MKIKTVSNERSKIIVNLISLAILVVVVFILIIITLHYEEEIIDKKDKKIYDYHLALSEKSVSILNAINQTNLWFIKHDEGIGEVDGQEISPVQTALTTRDQIESLMYSIDSSMRDVFLLQKKYPIPEFNIIDSLILKSYSDFTNRLQKIIHKGEVNYQTINAVTTPLFATVRQYRLLHQIAYKRERLSVRGIYYSNKSKVFLLLLVIITIGLVGSVVILRHVGVALRRLNVVNSELIKKSTIMDQINDSVIATTLKGVITSWNQGATNLFGYQSEEILGKNISILYDNDALYKFNNELVEKPKGTSANRLEIMIKHKSGRLVYTQLTLSMIRNDDNVDTGIIAYNTDISERKKNEEQISRLASVVENSLDFIGIASVEGYPVYLNHAGKDLIGIQRDDEDLMSNFLDYFSEDDKDILIKQIMPTVIDKGRWVGEINFQHLVTGALIPMWFDIFRIDDSTSGKPINIATVSRDLSELKNVERELAASELRFSTILESTPSGIFQTDAEGKCVYINETYQSIAGIELQDALGEGWANSIHPDDRDAVYIEWQESVAENRSFSSEYRMRTSSGEVVWVYAQSNAEKDITGNIISYIGTITDITENKLILNELENYQEVLEEKVTEQTQSISNALDIAERANKAKSDFLSHMSHELRTPLNAILGFTQMLKLDKEYFNEEQNENVTEIFDAGHHLLSLINDVLDLAKIEAGRFSLTIEPVMISDVVHESMTFIVAQAKNRNITIFNNIEDVDFCVNADYLRLKQVIINLLSNAVKYNCDNGRITLDTRLIDGGFLRVNVTDTGDGLTQDEMNHVFDDFERLNQTDNVEGTGVGLVISKNIIEIMGGTIGVKSEPSFGTVFWFDIPLFTEAKQ